jgi:hypothetical protein
MLQETLGKHRGEQTYLFDMLVKTYLQTRLVRIETYRPGYDDPVLWILHEIRRDLVQVL